MRGKRFSMGLRAVLAIFTVTVSVTSAWAATNWNEKVLHDFSNNGTDGFYPYGGLIFDAAGNLYGTTQVGGTYNNGTAFELTPTAGGGWTEQVLYSFGGGLYDGLIFDAAGNLYGTMGGGGVGGYGTVFELTPTAGGGWSEEVLYSFGEGTDGGGPYAGVIFDKNGNLYGTTTKGGTYGWGTVFELTPAAGGGWTETVLHSFNNNGTDGYTPLAGLIFDAVGNLYGTTWHGGAYGYPGGTVFELTPTAGGGWTETVLHSFNGTDGSNPYAGLIFDVAGNLYGTTSNGGDYGLGTVFELTPAAGGGWTEQVLHSFNGTDGNGPIAGLIFDKNGDLYGTTAGGGNYGHGTVFELTPTAGGGWAEQVLLSFEGSGGGDPQSGLIFDAAGNLYGTTQNGGAGVGTVFELSPIYPCAKCSHAVSSGEVDVLPAER